MLSFHYVSGQEVSGCVAAITLKFFAHTSSFPEDILGCENIALWFNNNFLEALLQRLAER